MTLTMQPAIEGFSLSGDGSTIIFAGSVSSTSCTGPDGNIWFTDGPNHRLGILNVVTRATTYFVPVGMNADAEPLGICSAYGYIYVCVPNKCQIFRMNTAGVIDINMNGLALNGNAFCPDYCIPSGSNSIVFTGRSGSNLCVGKIQGNVSLESTSLCMQVCKIAGCQSTLYLVTSAGTIPFSF